MLAFIRKLFTFGKKGDAAPETTAPAQQESADSDAEPLPESPHASKAWLALGLDGALSAQTGQGLQGPIGPPVYNTVQRLKDWVEHRDLTVRILTPRAATPEGAQAVRDWLRANGLPELEVTHRKDLQMVEFWSVNCVQVISNTGQIVGTSVAGLDRPAPATGNPAVAPAAAASASAAASDTALPGSE